MVQYISAIALLVADYDEAIAWYTSVLGFDLVEDTDMGGGKRWVRVRPSSGPSRKPGATEPGMCFLLAKAANEQQAAHIGNQTGGRVFLFLDTDDFARDYADYRAKGDEFEGEPRHEAYGDVAVFRDLYGNRWDLVDRE